MTDIIDQLAVLDASASAALRGHRPDVVASAQASYDALLPASLDADPVKDFGLDLRLLVALRASVLEQQEALVAHYTQRLGDSEVVGFAVSGPDRGAGLTASSSLRTILRHTDRLVLRAASATQSDLHALQAAGLDEASIVVLSQIASFVTFQARVVHGLRVLAATTSLAAPSNPAATLNGDAR